MCTCVKIRLSKYNPRRALITSVAAQETGARVKGMTASAQGSHQSGSWVEGEGRVKREIGTKGGGPPQRVEVVGARSGERGAVAEK